MDEQVCDYEVTIYVPKDVWASGLLPNKELLETYEYKNADQFQLAVIMDSLVRSGYSETKSITRDQETMSVFYSKEFGWRIITTNVKAPS